LTGRKGGAVKRGGDTFVKKGAKRNKGEKKKKQETTRKLPVNKKNGQKKKYWVQNTGADRRQGGEFRLRGRRRWLGQRGLGLRDKFWVKRHFWGLRLKSKSLQTYGRTFPVRLRGGEGEEREGFEWVMKGV